VGPPGATTADSVRSPADSCRTALAACLALLALGAALHLLYLIHDCPLDLAGDEAHYWEWARRPALSYYSKGPLVAYIIAASRAVLADWSIHTVGSEALAVRVPAVLLAALTGLGIFVLALDTLRRPWLALAAVAVTCTIPILAAGSILMTIDAPFVCAWTWALVVLHRAARSGALALWLAAGVLIAIGLLAKYTMLLLFPAFGLWLLIDPSVRPRLREPGPYAAAVLGLCGLLPIVIWNAANGWVSFRHVAGQAGVAGGPRFDPEGILAYVGGQAAVLGGVWFVGMIWALVDFYRRPQIAGDEPHDPPAVRLLLIAACVPWAVFLLFSPITKIQPNWPVVAIIPGTILMVAWLRRRLHLPTARGRAGARAFIAAGLIVGGGMVLIGHYSQWLMPAYTWLARDAAPWDLTPVAKYDPTARLRGWSQLGAAVGRVLAHERDAGRDPFILADNYQVASEVAFYTPGQPVVYCAGPALGARLSQYDIWENPIRDPDAFLNRPCVYVGARDAALTGENGQHAALPNMRLAETVEHRVCGQRLRLWTIYVCDTFAGFAEPATNGRRY
jgi:4-amino-4-deoxy-L-arabinose transferase-like glycosyltransferase